MSAHQLQRGRAEAAWQARHEGLGRTSPEDLARLVHDVEIHQVELEIQNEELRRAQRELEESRQQLSDLYDYAPVGYLTIDSNTIITQANLAVRGHARRRARPSSGPAFHPVPVARLAGCLLPDDAR